MTISRSRRAEIADHVCVLNAVLIADSQAADCQMVDSSQPLSALAEARRRIETFVAAFGKGQRLTANVDFEVRREPGDLPAR